MEAAVRESHLDEKVRVGQRLERVFVRSKPCRYLTEGAVAQEEGTTSAKALKESVCLKNSKETGVVRAERAKEGKW